MKKPNLMDLYVLYSNEEPTLIDFNSYSMYKSCTSKYEKYAQIILKLNSIFVSGKITMRVAKDSLIPLLDETNIDKNSSVENINLDTFTEKIAEPKVESIPVCLASELIDIKVREGIRTDDIMNPNNPKIEEINEYTKEASDEIVKSLDKITTSQKKVHILKYLDKLMLTVMNPKYITLFRSLDVFQDYINKTNFVKLYNEFRDNYECLSKNCKELKPYTPDDYFLWSDEEKTKFILPIDINNGQLRIEKFVENINKNQSNESKKIEKLYYDYVSKKDTIIAKAYNKVKATGKKDEDNPFYELLATNDPSKVINTLF